MSEDLQAHEEELVRLLAATRRAVADGAEPNEVQTLRDQAERAFSQWRIETSLALHRAVEQPVPLTERNLESSRPAPRTVREKAHAALLLLGTPAGPTLLSQVYGAFHDDALAVNGLQSLREGERNSHQVSQRPYFVCPVLTSDLQAAKGYYALSTWPLEQRIMTPHSSQLWQLQAIAHLAATVQSGLDSGQGVPQAALQLLHTTAASAGLYSGRPETIEAQAHRCMAPLLAEHQAYSAEVAGRAQALPDAGQLFGKGAVRLNHAQTAALWGLARESTDRVKAMETARPAPVAAAPSPATGPAVPAQASPRHSADPSPQRERAATVTR
ncbi:hypothetical protein [Streptomyces sp. NPDC102476]|uniref:hypothetical protein n=1 Tax=Streptomyces sp. NPDC102476 TaxID=3366181 RepID=UPI00382822A9